MVSVLCRKLFRFCPPKDPGPPQLRKRQESAQLYFLPHMVDCLQIMKFHGFSMIWTLVIVTMAGLEASFHFCFVGPGIPLLLS